jgi:hypothetical protein
MLDIKQCETLLEIIEDSYEGNSQIDREGDFEDHFYFMSILKTALSNFKP